VKKNHDVPVEWLLKGLSHLIKSMDAGVSVNSEDRKAENGEFGILKTSAVTSGVFDADENKVILPSEINSAKISPTFDRIIMSRMNTPALVGANAYVPQTRNNLFLPDRLWLLTPKEGCVNMRWLAFVLGSPKYRSKLSSFATGTSNSMKNITKDVVKSLQLLLPPLPEQKAIANLLSTWDEAIERTDRLIQAKESLKKNELYTLISSKKANSTIGAFAKPISRKVDKPDKSYIALGIRSHFKGTFQRVVENPQTVDMDFLYKVKENDLIVNITFAWEGAIALAKKEDEICYVSHRFPTYEIQRQKAEPCFIRQLIISNRMKYDLLNISPGGAGRNRVLNKNDFLNMPIWLPDIEPQRNIGEYLGTIDKEIDLLKKQAEAYRKQKRGLMQKLLTGQWRVKPEIVNQYGEI
jgi:type I restriction enzyme, S subunit